MGISAALGSSALLPAGLGFRNLLINGDFRVNQRGFSSTTTTGAYGFDRWTMIGNGGTTTYSAQTFSLGNAIPGYEPQNFARIVSSGQSASSSYSIFIQKIENVRTAAGLPVVLSFWAKAASGTPKVAIELYQYFGTGGSPSASVSTHAGQVTLSTSWQRFTVLATLPSIAGKTVGTTMDGALEVNMWVSGGSDYNSRTGSLGIQSNTFDFWGVQIEQNYQPTPFEQRPYGVELQLCQRYYYRYSNATLNGGGLGYISGFSSTRGFGYVHIPTEMRGSITITPTSCQYDTLSLSNAGNITALSTYPTVANAANTTTLMVDCTLSAGATAGTLYHFRVASGGAIQFSAEL